MTSTKQVLSVQAQWDDEAAVWVAMSDEVPGLVAESASLDALFNELTVLIPELLELNGAAGDQAVPFRLVAAKDEAPLATA